MRNNSTPENKGEKRDRKRKKYASKQRGEKYPMLQKL
jgi:hypothetical protein